MDTKSKKINVYDDFLDDKTHKEIYEWVQSVSWYCGPINKDDIPVLSDDVLSKFPFQEYNPTLMGKTPDRLEPADDDLKEIFKKIPFGMYRHPIGWNDKSTKSRNPLIWKLWTQINDKIFDGKASLDGMKEKHSGLYGPDRHFVDGVGFFEKYKFPKNIKEFTCFVNARPISTEKKHGKKWSDVRRVGHIHKDSDNTSSSKHFSVLYVVNPKWSPDCGGDIKFYGNEDTGIKHWKHGYNIGWPFHIVGHKPNTVIVYSHDQIHFTELPYETADEMSQKIAFRVVIND